MRRLFAVLAMLQTLLVVVQFYLAASGAFDATGEAFRPHEGLGFLILLYALLLTLVAGVARMPGRLVGLTGLVVVLGILQPVIAGVAHVVDDSISVGAGALVFGLHAVNGLAILALSGVVVRQAWGLTGSASTKERTVVSDSR